MLLEKNIQIVDHINISLKHCRYKMTLQCWPLTTYNWSNIHGYVKSTEPYYIGQNDALLWWKQNNTFADFFQKVLGIWRSFLETMIIFLLFKILKRLLLWEALIRFSHRFKKVELGKDSNHKLETGNSKYL